MRNKWRKSKPDAKKSFLAAKLFGPCRAGKHDQCAVELATYRCSCNCHYPKSDASEGERQPSLNVASANATQRRNPRKNNLKSYFAYERSRTHLALSCMGAKEPDGVLGKHNQSRLGETTGDELGWEAARDRLETRQPSVRFRIKRISAFLRPLSALLLALLVFQGCNALDLLCGSARPAPIIGSLSPSTITFAEVQQGFLLTVNGSHFVSSSVVVINGTTLSTKVTSTQQLQVTITTALISAPGTASVTVKTPGGTSGDLGCTSGGTSRALVLTIT